MKRIWLGLIVILTVAAIVGAIVRAIAQTRVTSVDLGPIWLSFTPSGTHNAGSSVGGLFTIPLAFGATAPPATGFIPYSYSGIMTQFAFKSTGASTGQIVVRLWSRKPATATCTDGLAYNGNNTDDTYLLTPPFALTPAAPASTTGDNSTYAQSTGLTLDWMNRDVPQTRNIYACIVTVAMDTADVGSAIYVMASGPQNP